MAALDFPASPTTGQVYTANGKTWAYDGTTWVIQSGFPAASFVGTKAYNSATQGLTNSTDTALTFNTEDFDTAGLHNTGSNTSRFTVPAGGAGYYAGVGGTQFAANATGRRQLYWKKNGSTSVTGSVTEMQGHATNDIRMQAPFGPIYLTVGDYVELIGNQDSGGSLNAGSASAGIASHASIYKVDGIVGGGTPSGTSFPATPGTGQQFFRTDLGYECYYDGTRWLSKHEIALPMVDTRTQMTVTGTYLYVTPDFSQSGMYITRLVGSQYINGATSSGSHYWTAQLGYMDSAASVTLFGGTYVTSAQAGSTMGRNTATINTVLSSSAQVLTMKYTVTGTPSGIYPVATVYYRLIVV